MTAELRTDRSLPAELAPSASAVTGVWHLDAPARPLTRLDGDRQADIVIIGAGTAGLSAAIAAARAGADVTVLDASTLGAHAAGANAGFLLSGGSLFFHQAVERWGTALATAIWQLTADEIADQAARWPHIVRRCASIRTAGWPGAGKPGGRLAAIGAFDDERRDLGAHHDALADADFDAVLDELGGTPALHIPSDGWCDPLARLSALEHDARTLGVTVCFDARAALHRAGGAWHAETPTGTVSAAAAVVATDARLDEQFPALAGIVASWRLQMLLVDRKAQGFDAPVYMRGGYDYAINTPRGLAIGGLRDIHTRTERLTPGAPVTAGGALQGDLLALARHLTGADAAPLWRWAAPVGYTNDGLPLVTELAPDLWVAGAYNGHGNVLSCILGTDIGRHLTGSPAPALSLLAR